LPWSTWPATVTMGCLIMCPGTFQFGFSYPKKRSEV
jgi:hypothetical protein